MSTRPAPEFALSFSSAAVHLMERAQGPAGAAPARGGRWRECAAASFDAPDFRAEMARLRGLAANGPDARVALIIPDDQILYTSLPVDAGADDSTDVGAGLGRALDGLTPYAVEELAWDWRPNGARDVRVAAVARQTLREAEDFARRHGFAASGFLGDPADGLFPAAPSFADEGREPGGADTDLPGDAPDGAGDGGIPAAGPDAGRAVDGQGAGPAPVEPAETALRDAPPDAPKRPHGDAATEGSKADRAAAGPAVEPTAVSAKDHAVPTLDSGATDGKAPAESGAADNAAVPSTDDPASGKVTGTHAPEPAGAASGQDTARPSDAGSSDTSPAAELDQRTTAALASALTAPAPTAAATTLALAETSRAADSAAPAPARLSAVRPPPPARSVTAFFPDDLPPPAADATAEPPPPPPSDLIGEVDAPVPAREPAPLSDRARAVLDRAAAAKAHRDTAPVEPGPRHPGARGGFGGLMVMLGALLLGLMLIWAFATPEPRALSDTVTTDPAPEQTAPIDAGDTPATAAAVSAATSGDDAARGQAGVADAGTAVSVPETLQAASPDPIDAAAPVADPTTLAEAGNPQGGAAAVSSSASAGPGEAATGVEPRADSPTTAASTAIPEMADAPSGSAPAAVMPTNGPGAPISTTVAAPTAPTGQDAAARGTEAAATAPAQATSSTSAAVAEPGLPSAPTRLATASAAAAPAAAAPEPEPAPSETATTTPAASVPEAPAARRTAPAATQPTRPSTAPRRNGPAPAPTAAEADQLPAVVPGRRAVTRSERPAERPAMRSTAPQAAPVAAPAPARQPAAARSSAPSAAPSAVTAGRPAPAARPAAPPRQTVTETAAPPRTAPAPAARPRPRPEEGSADESVTAAEMTADERVTADLLLAGLYAAHPGLTRLAPEVPADAPRFAEARPARRPGAPAPSAVDAAVAAAVQAAAPERASSAAPVKGSARPAARASRGGTTKSASTNAAADRPQARSPVEDAIAEAVGNSTATPGGVNLGGARSMVPARKPARPSAVAKAQPKTPAADAVAEAVAAAAAARPRPEPPAPSAPVPTAPARIEPAAPPAAAVAALPPPDVAADQRLRDEQLQAQAEARARARASADAQAEMQARAAAEARARAQAQAEERAAIAARGEYRPPEVDDEPEIAVQPAKGSTTGTVASAATVGGMDLGKTQVIGVIGAGRASRGLIRLRNGKIVTVRLGDRIDGGAINSIGNGRISYVKGGRQYNLPILNGR